MTSFLPRPFLSSGACCVPLLSMVVISKLEQRHGEKRLRTLPEYALRRGCIWKQRRCTLCVVEAYLAPPSSRVELGCFEIDPVASRIPFRALCPACRPASLTDG